jgi:hypothetical protein
MIKKIITFYCIVIFSQTHAMLTTLSNTASLGKTKINIAYIHSSPKNECKKHDYYGDEDLHILITENICNNLSAKEWNYKIREHCWNVRESDQVYLHLKKIVQHEDAKKIISTTTRKTVLFHKVQSIIYGSSAMGTTVLLPVVTAQPYDLPSLTLLWATALILIPTLIHSTRYHYRQSNDALVNAENNVHILNVIIKNTGDL